MNLVRVGCRTVNMDLVIVVEDRDGLDGRGGVAIVYALGGTFLLEGEEAASMRRFVSTHSRAPETGESGPGTRPPPSAFRFAQARGGDLDRPRSGVGGGE